MRGAFDPQGVGVSSGQKTQRVLVSGGYSAAAVDRGRCQTCVSSGLGTFPSQAEANERGDLQPCHGASHGEGGATHEHLSGSGTLPRMSSSANTATFIRAFASGRAAGLAIIACCTLMWCCITTFKSEKGSSFTPGRSSARTGSVISSSMAGIKRCTTMARCGSRMTWKSARMPRSTGP